MKFLKESALVGLTFCMLGCSPNYEKVILTDMVHYPVQYIDRYVEVQGKTLNLNNGELALGGYYSEPSISTDCSPRKDKKRAKKLHDIVFNDGKLIYADRVVVKGRFNENKILEVKEGFVEIDGKKYRF